MLIRMRKIKAVCWVYAVHMQGRFDLDFMFDVMCALGCAPWSIICDIWPFFLEPSGGKTCYDTC